MNIKQRNILKIMVVVIVLTGLFPPWVQTFKKDGMYSEKSLGYFIIISPPHPESTFRALGIKIDFSRLFLQWFLIGLIGASAIVFTTDKKEKSS
jgi:hypothetical protein